MAVARCLAIALAYLVCLGLARRVNTPTGQKQESQRLSNGLLVGDSFQTSQSIVISNQTRGHWNAGGSGPRSLASLMLAFHPAAALNQGMRVPLAKCLPLESRRMALQRLRGGSGKPLQLISGSGKLQASSASKIAGAAPGGVSLSVVASMGKQHYGRRLLNAIFGTSFDGSIQLGAEADAAGAWLAASPISPNCLVLETRPLSKVKGQQNTVDSCKLACFALALSDAMLIHSPCVSPSFELLKEMYERIFSHHLRAILPNGAATGQTMLVHVRDPAEGLSESVVRAACQSAWSTAIANTEFAKTAFTDLFDLKVVSVAGELDDPDGFAAGVAELKTLLAGLPGKLPKGSDFSNAAATAWKAASIFDNEPSEAGLQDLYFVTRAYEAAYTQGQELLRHWASRVAKGHIIQGFGQAASAMLSAATATFDAGVSTCSAIGSEMLSQRRARLVKALQNDMQELFAKQQRLLTASIGDQFQAMLSKACGRSGTIADWQLNGLRRSAEKEFDAAIRDMVVDVAMRTQLTTAFGKHLTEVTSKLLDSPQAQLKALEAMRRKGGKNRKPNRGLRAGLGLVGAFHNSLIGGKGNVQTYAGYSLGLNSVNLMLANDGTLLDANGKEPPAFKFQPKLNFEVSI